MKTRVWNYLLPLLFLISGISASGQQQNDVSVPGDNFSLEGALDLFKKSSSPEEFEKMLNSPDSKVNNLDLNGDGQIDYIRVIDKNEGNVHAFILQSVISQNESQDVAVIELEKQADGKAVLQIIGDADVYGTETIIEPTTEVRVNAGTSTARNVVNVWTWPSVQYVYSPYYSPWISPWGWSAYPMWWSPWSPVAFAVYNPWWIPYRTYYTPYYSFRIGYAQRIYRPYRTTSVIVYNRHHAQIANYRSHHDYYYSGHNSGHNNGRDRGRSAGNSYQYQNQNNGSRSGRQSANNTQFVDRNFNRSAWRTDRSTSVNQNYGGRSFSDQNLSRSTQHFSSQREPSFNRGHTLNSGNSNNWQRMPNLNSGMNRGGGSQMHFNRSQSTPSFQRSAPSGGGMQMHHSGGNNSRGRH
jgi:hypothetical protein